MLGGEYFKTTLLRPNHDHTFGNGTGSYLFLSNFERNTGDKADLIGEVISSSRSITQCVEFWYDINGDKETTLQVLAVDAAGKSRQASLLWTQKGSDKSTWQMGQLAPPAYSRVDLASVQTG
ncbi:MAM and LDL-receptor class A domain-containing protein 1-like [Rhipicephalus sanguineus]|uniref:MAM and LDL-receptor class A domain-containing protein 1-like n=1 Tax=Rhipicephalus sanguineus TaxID=34632 RepID=UPI0020C47C0A|nr:MAM and LDL-receptor class A domain-containing protein 1-like [Rhipicephalus sanguineus]